MIFFVSTCNKELRQSQKTFIYESTLSKYNIKPMYANYDIRLKNLSKILRMKTLLDKLKYNDEDIIIDTDCFDFVFIKNPLEMIEKFKQENVDLIIGAEPKCANHTQNCKKFFENTYPNSTSKYLNSGFKIGYVKVYHEVLKEIVNDTKKYIPDNYTSDQRVLSRYCFKTNFRNNTIRIDDKNEYVTTLCSTQEYIKENINSYCLHITWLKNEKQRDKYKQVLIDYAILM
jgi:hypothetical protein